MRPVRYWFSPKMTKSQQVVAERVPPYVYTTQMAFKHCAVCDRLYWGGTHRDNMLRQLHTILGGLLPSNSADIALTGW